MTKKLAAVMLAMLFASAVSVSAQVSEIKVGVDGFTCSLCAKGVEGQFKALDFVKTVVTDLKNTTFTIVPMESAKIELRTIRDAVTDGGFTLREISIEGKGSIEKKSAGGFFVSTSNMPPMELHGLKVELTENEKVKFQGKAGSDLKSLNVNEISRIPE